MGQPKNNQKFHVMNGQQVPNPLYVEPKPSVDDPIELWCVLCGWQIVPNQTKAHFEAHTAEDWKPFTGKAFTTERQGTKRGRRRSKAQSAV